MGEKEETMETAIHKEMRPRFGRAAIASIYNGPGFALLGYTADTEAGI